MVRYNARVVSGVIREGWNGWNEEFAVEIVIVRRVDCGICERGVVP